MRRFSNKTYRGKVEDLLQLWADRHIYSPDYIQELRSKIKEAGDAPPPPAMGPRMSYNIRALVTYLDALKRDKARQAEIRAKLEEQLGPNTLATDDFEAALREFEQLTHRVKCNRRYLVGILGNLGQAYRSELNIRLHKMNEVSSLLKDLKSGMTD